MYYCKQIFFRTAPNPSSCIRMSSEGGDGNDVASVCGGEGEQKCSRHFFLQEAVGNSKEWPRPSNRLVFRVNQADCCRVVSVPPPGLVVVEGKFASSLWRTCAAAAANGFRRSLCHQDQINYSRTHCRFGQSARARS